MNSFIESLNLWAARFLEFAVPMIWQSSLLIALIFLLDFALRRKVRAAIRYALWFVVLLKLLLPPTLALPTGAAWWLRTHQTRAPTPTRILTVTYPEQANDFPQPVIAIPAPAPPPPRLSAAGWMLLASAAGSIFLLAWLLARWRQITWQVRQASPAPPEIVELFNQLKRETVRGFHEPGNADPPSSDSGATRHRAPAIHTNLQECRGEKPRASSASQSGAESPHSKTLTRSQEPQIRLVRDSISPAVCGLFRPVILLPQALAERLSPEQLRAVLLHELIHLRRRDVWMNCFQTFLQIAYWWHPLLWLANARIRRLREESVDDAVMLALNEKSEVYAPTLLEVAKLAFNRPLASLGLVGILESKNALRQRIERLLNFTTPRRAGLSVMSVVCIAAFTAVAVPMGEAPPRSSDPGAGLDSANLIPYHRKVDPEVFIRNIKARADGMMHTTNDPWGDILLTILDGYNCRPPGGIELNRQTGELTTQNTSEALQTLDEVIAELNLPGGERVLNPPYGLKQVLIEAHFYQMQPQQFAQLDLNSAYRNRDRNNSPSWQLTSNQINQVNQIIKNLGLQPFSSARIQTSHSIQADLFEGDKTNSIELDCLPYIHDGAVDLTVLARTTGQSAPPGGWRDFADHTNCAIFSRLGFEDGGGAVLQAQPAEAAPQSNLVVLLRARIIQHSPTAANGSAPRASIGPEQRTVHYKLNNLTFDRIGYPDISLGEVVSNLAEMVKLRDPNHEGIKFFINESPGTNRPGSRVSKVVISLDPPLKHVKLLDVLIAIVKTADHPIKYRISDRGIEFSFRGPAVPEFFSGTYKLDPKSEIFKNEAIDFSTPESFFLNEKQGALTGYTTADDLDLPDALVNVVFVRPPPEANTAAPAAPPADLDAALQDGKLLFERGKLDEAEARFQEVLQRDPENQAALYYLNLIKQQRTRNTTDSDSSNLETRTFQLDANKFYLNLQKLGFANSVTNTRLSSVATQSGIPHVYVQAADPKSAKSDSETAVMKFLHATGVDFSPPKTVSFDNAHCALTVHVTADDLDLIEAAIVTLGVAPPEVNIKVRFVELLPDSDWAQKFDWYSKESTTNNSFTAVLTDPYFRTVLEEIEKRHGADLLNEGNVTTLTGRQAQFADLEAQTNSDNTMRFADPLGTIVNVLPFVSSDNSTIQMNTIVTVTEFTGYDSPGMPLVGDPPKLSQPHSRVRQFTNSCSIPDGTTIVLAAPNPRQTNSLLVFITPTLIDSAGNRLYAAHSKDNPGDLLRALRSNDYYDGPSL